MWQTWQPRGGRGRGGFAGSGGDVTTNWNNCDLMQVSKGLVGLVIGTHGETIRRINQTSGAHVEIMKPPPASYGPDVEVFCIRGMQWKREVAKQLIKDIIGSKSMLEEQVPVPSDQVGLVIGKRGQTIRSIRQQSGVYHVRQVEDPPQNGMDMFSIKGTRAQIDEAKRLISGLLRVRRTSSYSTGTESEASTKTDGQSRNEGGSIKPLSSHDESSHHTLGHNDIQTSVQEQGSVEANADETTCRETAAESMFRDLLQFTTESTHLDFKREYDLTTEKKKDDFVTDIVSMYNGIGGDRFPGTNGVDGVSSYLLVGLEHHPGEPLRYQPLLHGRPDDACIPQIVGKRIRPHVPVLYHDIRIKDDPNIEDGLYGLIEIRKKATGPAYILPTNKTGIDTNRLYTRQGGSNINPQDVTDSQRKDVFEQFQFGYDPHSLPDIRDRVEGLGQDVYKIFVVNTAEEGGDRGSGIAKAVAEAQPSVIIDLDYNTRRTGFHKEAAPHLMKNRPFQMKNYQELAGISDNEMAYIAQDSATLYILANGCPDTKCPKPPTMNKSTTNIHKFLRRIFTLMKQPKPVVCYYLVRSETELGFMKKLISRIEVAYESAEGNMGEGSLLFIILCDQQRLKDAFSGDGGNVDDDNGILSCAPMPQVSQLLSDLYSTSHNTGKYTFPGVSGPAFISQEEYVSMSDKVVLFYSGVGHGDLTEGEIDDIRLKYLQGGEITPEVLQLDRSTKSYVFRSLFDDPLKKLCSRLEQTKDHFWKRNHEAHKNIFSIYHDPSSGGTTAGKVLLWHLHQDWPCVEINSLDDIDWMVTMLKLLQSRSQKSLVILLDHPDFTTPKVQVLAGRLSNALIKAVIINIIPITMSLTVPESWKKDVMEGKLKDAYHNPSELRWHITSYLEDRDLKGFGDLYKMTEEKRKSTGARKVFLLGLHAFLREYTRIEEHVKTCVNNSTEEERRLLRMSCILWQYTRRAMPLALAARVLDIPLPECGKLAEFEKSNRPLADLLIKNNDGLRPGHDLVVEDALKMCTSSCEPGDEKVQRFADFMSDFLPIIGPEDDRQACVHDIVWYLMTERKDPVHHYSNFVRAHINTCQEKYLDASRTAQDICSLADALGKVKYGAHIRALHARILMYQMGDVEKSLEEMNSALEIDSDDCVLHTIKGNLLKERLKRATRAAGPGDILNVLQWTKEAVDVFAHALSLPNARSNYPHIAMGEIQTRLVLLKYVFRTCGGRHVPYMELVESHTNSILRESEKESLRLLDVLDLKLSQDEYGDLIVQRTKELALEARIDLFKLRCDLKGCFELKKGRIKGLAQEIPEEAACSISYIIRDRQTGGSSGEPRKLRPWHTLSKNELKIIIDALENQLSPVEKTSKLRICYQDLIKAMVFIRQKDDDRFLKYNLDLALEYAKQWVSKFKTDHEAHFMLGILTFVKGLEGDSLPNSYTIQKAMQSFKECQRICEGLKTTQNFRILRYCIGTRGGLSSVIPHFEDIMKKASPRRFTGIFRKGRYVNVREVEPAYVEAKVSLKHGDDKLALFAIQQPTIEYSLAISHDTIFAIEVEMCEDVDSDE